MVHEAGDLVAALPQRSQREADDVETVEQVFAKPARVDGVLQVRVGRGDDADVDGDRARLAERGDLAGFEEAQELGLQVESELADFVEEERAFAGGANETELVAVGAGEGAAPMAKEVALEQVPRDGGAVERDERLAAAVGEVVDGAGENFLPGAALAGDEDVDFRFGDAPGVVHQLAHVAADYGVVAFDRQFVDGPERGAFFALDAGSLQLLEGRHDCRYGVEYNDRFQTGFRFHRKSDSWSIGWT